MTSATQKVAILGAGYVGLTTGVALAYLGHRVSCIDVDREKVGALQAGRCPIFEPHIESLLGQPHLEFTADWDAVAEADTILICVGTPPGEDGGADLSHVEAAAQRVGELLQPNRSYVIAVKSTVPVGTAQRVGFLVQQALARRQAHTTACVASNPEFLREGAALYDMLYPDRIVVGAGEELASHRLWHLYRPILEQSFRPPPDLPRPDGLALPAFVLVDTASSELIKYAANAFLAAKISFINEISGLCEKVGADVREVARGIGLDKRIGPGFLQAGIGWGGSCFGKDTLALIKTAQDYHYPMRVVQAVREVNYAQRLWVITQLQAALKTLRGKTIGVLGLAFKPDTDDVRDAPSLDILKRLVELGAHVRAHDPAAAPNARKALAGLEVYFASQPQEVFQGADAVLILTEWKAYRTLPFAELVREMKQPLIVDGRNWLDAEALCAQGYRVIGVGRPCEFL